MAAMMSIFMVVRAGLAIATARRTSTISLRALGPFVPRWRAIELATWSFTIAFIARLAVARASIAAAALVFIFAFVLRETLARRWFAHPRRQ
jgi:hypothetical protein